MQAAVEPDKKRPSEKASSRLEGKEKPFQMIHLTKLLEDYWQWALLLLFAIPLSAMLYYQFLASGPTATVQDYLAAEAEFSKFQNAEEQADRRESYMQFTGYLEKLPELQSKYDGLAAETLIIRGSSEKSEKIIKRSIDRTDMDLYPNYDNFALTTLDIVRGDAAAALQKTAEPAAGSKGLLYALNLLRKAALEKNMGRQEDELASLKKLDNFLQLPENLMLKETLVRHFESGSVNFLDYMKARTMVIQNESNLQLKQTS